MKLLFEKNYNPSLTNNKFMVIVFQMGYIY